MMTPLEDPEHPPVNGRPPDVVAKWDAASQLRWFRRFPGLAMKHEEWNRFYCSSEQHRGQCCDSCLDDIEAGYDIPLEDLCCCRALKESSGA